jgi:hypothetical protein
MKPSVFFARLTHTPRNARYPNFFNSGYRANIRR